MSSDTAAAHTLLLARHAFLRGKPPSPNSIQKIESLKFPGVECKIECDGRGFIKP